MTLAIELSPAEETALTRMAEQRIKNQATIELLDSWIKEAAAMSDEEAEEAEREWRESMRDLDAHRESYRKLFPELADGGVFIGQSH